MLDEIKGTNTEMPDFGQHWDISKGSISLFQIVIKKDPYVVQFFGPNPSAYPLSNLEFVYKNFFKEIKLKSQRQSL